MKTLLLMRHAKSSWSDAGVSDHDRTLNDRGHRDAPRMGKWLIANEAEPDLIVHSTATRATLTAQILANQFDQTPFLREEASLYLAPPHTYIDRLAEVESEFKCVMLVGHNPGMEDLVSRLMNQPVSMPTSAIAHLELNVTDWSQVRDHDLSTLVEHVSRKVWRPKEIND